MKNLSVVSGSLTLILLHIKFEVIPSKVVGGVAF